MAPDHLYVEPVDYIAQVELTSFSRNLSMENDLKKQVAQFLSEFRRIRRIQRIEYFVSLLDQHRLQRFSGLLPIPRAPVFTAQAGHEVYQFLYVSMFFHHAIVRVREARIQTCGQCRMANGYFRWRVFLQHLNSRGSVEHRARGRLLRVGAFLF
jgi:hypothetical protein